MKKTCDQDYYSNSILGNLNDDRFWIYEPSTMHWSPPLIINRAGYSRWTKGRFWRHRNSGKFGIEYVCDGDALFVQDGKEYIVKPGWIFINRPRGDQFFSHGPSGHLHKRYLYMEGPLLEYLLQTFNLNSIDIVKMENRTLVLQRFKELYRVLSTPGESYEKSHKIYMIANSLLCDIAHDAARSTYPDHVNRAIEFMSRNLNRNITLERIAKESGLSLYHFSRIFSSTVNTSPMKYFLQRRMEYAATLLRTTSLLIKEVTALCGFEDSFYFAIQFKKWFGKTPREYRSMHLQERLPSPRMTS